MQATKQGIEISKAELGALLFFAGGATKEGVVKFKVGASAKLTACASDGKRAVECEADAGDCITGEWAVPASFLETLRRGINKGKTEAVIVVKDTGLKHALLRGAASKDKQIAIEDESNGTSTQLSMPQIHAMVKRPELEGSWFAILPKNLNRAIDVVHKAADSCPITVYPPKEATDAIRFEASCEGGRWRGTLPTAAVVAPGDEAEEDDEDEAPGRQPRQQALPGTDEEADDDDDAEEGDGDASGIVDDDYQPGATQKKARKKAAKKTAKKAAKKAGKKK
jgi:hypothetical protein